MQSSLYVHGRHPRWKGKRNLGLWEHKGCTREEEETEHKKPAKQWLLQAFPSKLPCSPDLIHSHFNKCVTPRVLSSNPLESSLSYLWCLPFDRKFCKFWMEGKWWGYLLEVPTKVHSFRLEQTKRKCCLDPLTNFLVPSRFQTHATQIHPFLDSNCNGWGNSAINW